MKGSSICLNCESEFTWERANTQPCPKYCCNPCREAHKKAKVTFYGNTECQTCGSLFHWKRSIKQGAAKFCSNKCKKNHLGENNFFDRKLKIFNRHVVKYENSCWDWKGYIRGGYSVFMVNKKHVLAHRFSWSLLNGEIPKEKQINHHCDNPKCTRPDHLYLGTSQENDRDRVARDRQAKGSKNGDSKLNEEKVSEIKKLLKMGVTITRLAKDYNVSQTCIWLIKSGKKWKHVVG